MQGTGKAGFSASSIAILTGMLIGTVHAAPGDEQLQHQQAQQKARQQRLMPAVPDVRLSEPLPVPSRQAFPVEKPCFVIDRVTLSGQQALPHWVPLQRLADRVKGHCLGIQGINQIMSTLQKRNTPKIH